ncbi:hypothetical protein llap_7755 [Limosa lapponica baueri]|uniref:Uncharacterized protein n=1 Tax=Limosa lapponica baueri TaxID=1758121 RepID=A0A2I0U7E7_LIMLA|nr:hypothetical protein llap_7755 [Limosa lapponica baueri]
MFQTKTFQSHIAHRSVPIKCHHSCTPSPMRTVERRQGPETILSVSIKLPNFKCIKSHTCFTYCQYKASGMLIM